MTKAEFLAQLDSCGGDLSQHQVIDYLYSKNPNAMYSDLALALGQYRKTSAASYFSSRFPKEVMKDWSGVKEMGQVYHNAHIPFDLGVFQRSMQVCNAASLNECDTTYCEIPEGGISSLPEMEMWKTGLKTRRMCIANIRTSAQAKKLAQFLINERFQADENVINMFYVMAAIRMLGHKWVLEYDPTTNQPIVSNNPYNMIRGYRYSYMDPLFPQVGNIQNIAGLDMHFLDSFGRGLARSQNPNSIATGSRGEPIFELWVGDDWYRQEVLDNAEWVDKMKSWVDNSILPGYTNMSGRSELVGNFKIKDVPALPRFAESTNGGFAIVQETVEVEIEQGTRSLHNYREFDNAPFQMALILGNNIGKIITRPALTVGIEGKPIHPIAGDGPWEYRNDYDKECNEDLNKPHFRKRYEMGFRLENPDAGQGIIYRAKKFRTRPIDTCNLREVIQITPTNTACNIVQIGCVPTETHPNHFFRESSARKVMCSSAACGDNTIQKITVRREHWDSIAPSENPFTGCRCGDGIKLIISDAEGVEDSVIDGTIVEFFPANVIKTDPVYWVKTVAAIATGKCVTAVVCDDATPNLGVASSCMPLLDAEGAEVANSIVVALDSILDNADVGDTVLVKYYNAANTLLGTIEAEITAANHTLFRYTLEGSDGFGGVGEPATFSCDSFDHVKMTVTLD